MQRIYTAFTNRDSAEECKTQEEEFCKGNINQKPFSEIVAKIGHVFE